jgi:hypothetical protein
MKNKTLLTAALVIVVCSCLFAGIYNYRSVNCDESNPPTTYSRTLQNEETDEEQGEFMIWKSIPRYLLMVNR